MRTSASLHANPQVALSKFKRDVSSQPAVISSEAEVGHLEAKHEQNWKNMLHATQLYRSADDATFGELSRATKKAGGAVVGGVAKKYQDIKDWYSDVKAEKAEKKRLGQVGETSISDEQFAEMLAKRDALKAEGDLTGSQNAEYKNQLQEQGNIRREEESRRLEEIRNSQEVPNEADMSMGPSDYEYDGPNQVLEDPGTVPTADNMDIRADLNPEPKKKTVKDKLNDIVSLGRKGITGLAYGSAMLANPFLTTAATALYAQKRKHDKDFESPQSQATHQAESTWVENKLIKDMQGGANITEEDINKAIERGESPRVEYEEDADAWWYQQDYDRATTLKHGDVSGQQEHNAELKEYMKNQLSKSDYKKWERRQTREAGGATSIIDKTSQAYKKAMAGIQEYGTKQAKKNKEYYLRKHLERESKKMAPEVEKMGMDVIMDLHSQTSPDRKMDWMSVRQQNKKFATSIAKDMVRLGIDNPDEQREYIRLNYALNMANRDEKGNFQDTGGKLTYSQSFPLVKAFDAGDKLHYAQDSDIAHYLRDRAKRREEHNKKHHHP